MQRRAQSGSHFYRNKVKYDYIWIMIYVHIYVLAGVGKFLVQAVNNILVSFILPHN
jgi:hypothetical protein